MDYLRTQMLKEKLTSLKIRLGESGEEIELPVIMVQAENDCDCYRVEVVGTPVEEWLKGLSKGRLSMKCEVIGNMCLLFQAIQSL